jgi:acyl-CoA thioesterase FadM
MWLTTFWRSIMPLTPSWTALGMGQDYRNRENCSAFVVETHVNYQRELMAGDPLRITTQLLGFDSKRVHYFHRLYHATRGFLSATTELMVIHVDLAERHSAPMPLAVLDRLSAVMTAASPTAATAAIRAGDWGARQTGGGRDHGDHAGPGPGQGLTQHDWQKSRFTRPDFWYAQ